MPKHDGHTLNRKCADCGTPVGKQATRCYPCSRIYISVNKLNPGNYKDSSYMIKSHCIDCGKELVKPHAKRCKECYKVVLRKRLQENPVNPKGSKLTTEQIHKMSLAKLGKPGNRLGKKLTEEQRSALSLAHGGTGIPNHLEPNDGYPSEFNKELKMSIFKRDNFNCQHPDCIKRGGDLTVHHIDWDKKNLNYNNLVTLCRVHNSAINVDREYWKQYFQKGR